MMGTASRFACSYVEEARSTLDLGLLLAFFLGFDSSLTFTFGIDLCREGAGIVSEDVKRTRIQTHSSNCRAIRYMKKIWTVKNTPAARPL